MSSGEVTVAVRAEGADEAAAELAEGASPDVSAGDGDGEETEVSSGGGIGDMLGRLGGIGKLLGIVVALISALGPLVKLIEGVFDILSAFLAPLAMMLIRLFQPVLRLMIQLLPAWFAFMDFVDDLLSMAIEFLSSLPGRIWSFMRDLPGMIWSAISDGASWLADGAESIGSAVWSAIKDGASWIAEGAKNIGEMVWDKTTTSLGDLSDLLADLPGDLWDEMKALPGLIADELKDAMPGGDGLFELATGGVVTSDTVARIGEAGPEAVIPLDRLDQMLSQPQGAGGDTRIELRGGLSEFVSGARRDPNIDL